MMNLLPYVVAYIALGIFAVAVVARFLMWSRLPLHIRWELYPVAHEGKKAHYGGSYLEETDWWKKPRESSMIGELKVMVPEILFLEALFKHNRKLWLSSYPFHLGIYLVIGCTVLLFANGVLRAIAPDLLVNGMNADELTTLGSILANAILACGAAGLILGLLGAIGLLLRRLFDSELKDFTTGADIFNLVFFLLAFGLALVTFIIVDPGFQVARFFAYSLITFRMEALPGMGGDGTLTVILPTLSIVLLSLLLAYIPLTHMSHFIGKFFAYHAIRWNDTPNLRGGEEEAKIQKLLSHPVSWNAPHIQGQGKKTWAELATEEQKK